MIPKLPLSADDILFMSDLVTRHGRLVMGAPSSPSLTNVMMFNYDRKFSELAQIHDAKYTRYADDLFFSVASHGALLGIKTSVEEIVESSKTPRLKLNTDKTAYLSKRNKRTITGMIITSDGEASLGRERKRKIKSLLYQAITGKLEKVRLAEVSGLINWSKAADPAFVLSLYKKYGIDAVDRFTGGNRLHQRAGRKP